MAQQKNYEHLKTTDVRDLVDEPVRRSRQTMGRMANRRVPAIFNDPTCDWAHVPVEGEMTMCGEPAYYWFGSPTTPRFYCREHGEVILARSDKAKKSEKGRPPRSHGERVRR